MFYEIKTNALTVEGKDLKEDWLVEAENIVEAIYTACEEANTTDVLKASVSSIYEVVNETEFELKDRYVAEVQTDGTDKKLKYKLFVYASDFEEAKKKINEHLKQGFDGFELSGLNLSRIVKYIKNKQNGKEN